jgi:hypothetical protein
MFLAQSNFLAKVRPLRPIRCNGWRKPLERIGYLDATVLQQGLITILEEKSWSAEGPQARRSQKLGQLRGKR